MICPGLPKRNMLLAMLLNTRSTYVSQLVVYRSMAIKFSSAWNTRSRSTTWQHIAVSRELAAWGSAALDLWYLFALRGRSIDRFCQMMLPRLLRAWAVHR